MQERVILTALKQAYGQGCTKLRKTVYRLAKTEMANLIENLYSIPEEALLLEIGAEVVRQEAPVLPVKEKREHKFFEPTVLVHLLILSHITYLLGSHEKELEACECRCGCIGSAAGKVAGSSARCIEGPRCNAVTG